MAAGIISSTLETVRTLWARDEIGVGYVRRNAVCSGGVKLGHIPDLKEVPSRKPSMSAHYERLRSM